MTDPGRGVELEIPAHAEFLSLVRAVVASAAALDPRLRDERIEDLRLAVSEATTNAIESHAQLGSEERIAIHCDLGEDRIEVEVHDHGEGFDPESLSPLPPPTDPERLEYEHGLGLPLMRVLADETRIRTGADGTAVSLVVYSTPGDKA